MKLLKVRNLSLQLVAYQFEFDETLWHAKTWIYHFKPKQTFTNCIDSLNNELLKRHESGNKGFLPSLNWNEH